MPPTADTPAAGGSKPGAKPGKPGTTAAAAAGDPKRGGPTPSPGPLGVTKAAVSVVGATAAPSSDPHYELEPAASAADIPVPEYGTVAWVINSCLMLIGSRAFEYGELKKAMLQAVIIVITGNRAKYNEPVLFMRIMVSDRGGPIFRVAGLLA